MFFEIFQYLDLSTFKTCRLVCQKWKGIVIEACWSRFELIFPFTDETFRTAEALTQDGVGIHIHDITKNMNDPKYIENAEDLFGKTETMKFSGNNIEPAEVTKILHCALDRVKTLSFQGTKGDKPDCISPLLEMNVKFNAIVKLTVCRFTILSVFHFIKVTINKFYTYP